MRALLLSLHSVASRELLGRYARLHINALLQATVLQQISPAADDHLDGQVYATDRCLATSLRYIN